MSSITDLSASIAAYGEDNYLNEQAAQCAKRVLKSVLLPATAIPAGGTTGTGIRVSTTANFGVFFGSGPPTLSAAQGSLYLRSDGTTTNDRVYINQNGSTGWTALTTAA